MFDFWGLGLFGIAIIAVVFVLVFLAPLGIWAGVARLARVNQQVADAVFALVKIERHRLHMEELQTQQGVSEDYPDDE